MECEGKSDTGNDRGNWNHFKINRTKPEQHNRKREFVELKKTCEITLHIAQIVNTEQLQHYIL